MEDGLAAGLQHALDSTGQMGVVIVFQYSGTPREYTKMISCDGYISI
jgi:hypothetical protein